MIRRPTPSSAITRDDSGETAAAYVHEVEALGADPARMRAGQALLKGDAAKAADHVQRAYDLISEDANTAPECLVRRL